MTLADSSDTALIGQLRARVAELERLVEQLRCGDLVRYVDGELEAARAAGFRAHLQTCETCQAELPYQVELLARLANVGPRRKR